MLPHDLPPWPVAYQQMRCWLAGCFEAMVHDLRGPAAQEVIGETVELAYMDQGYTGDAAAKSAQAHGIQLVVVKLPEAKRGFLLFPRRWVARAPFRLGRALPSPGARR